MTFPKSSKPQDKKKQSHYKQLIKNISHTPAKLNDSKVWKQLLLQIKRGTTKYRLNGQFMAIIIHLIATSGIIFYC